MRHIKTFERYGYYGKEEGDLDVDDYVILLKQSRDTKFENFVVGNIYHITLTDYGSKLPYEIGEITETCGAWVREDQIRKATEIEIERVPALLAAIKYNI